MSALGPIELLIILGMLAFAVPVWAVVDASLRPDSQWAAADQNKLVWVLVLGLGILAGPVGFVLAIVYFASVRPKLNRASSG